MNRRDFLTYAGIVSASLALRGAEPLFEQSTAPDSWRIFEVTTRVEVLKPFGATRIWVPAALITETPFQKTLANTFDAGAGTAKKMVASESDALGIIVAEYAAGVRPVLTVTSRVTTRNCAVDLSAPGTARKVSPSELEHFLRPTKLLPTDGIVKRPRPRSPQARIRMLKRHALFMSGLSKTHFVIRKRAVAASVTSASCLSPNI